MADPHRDTEDALSLRLTAEVLSAHPTRVGDYRLTEPLGKGGMGAVYKAEDTRDGRVVAVKLILPAALADPVAKARFLREAAVQAQVKSDHVVPVYEVGEADGVPFLVLPLLRGETLEARLARERVPPLGVTLKVAREVAEGLAAADAAGIVHRDIKPSNVWLDGEPMATDPRRRFLRCVLLDFGLARQMSVPMHRLTATQELVGTPAYMSPERVNAGPVDGRSDLFGLGVILYEMATGRHPFDDPNPYVVLMNVSRLDPPPVREVNPRVPEDLAGLIARLMAKEPAGRPATARGVADEVRAMPAGSETLADFGPDGGATRTLLPVAETRAFRRPQGRRRLAVVGSAVVAAGFAVGAGVWLAVRPTPVVPPVPPPPPDATTEVAPPPRAKRGPIALDAALVPAGERWPGAPAELVGVVGSSARQPAGGVGLLLAHPAGEWVATLPATTPIRRAALWNPATLAPAGAFDWDGDALAHLAVSRDGKVIAAGERHGRAALYGADFKPRGRLPDVTTGFAFLPDGSMLAAGLGGKFAVRDAAGPGPRRAFTLPPLAFDKDASTRVEDFVLSADGSTLAVNCANRVVRVWDIARDPPVELGALHRPGRYWAAAALAPDGKALYTLDFSAGEDGAVRAWRVGPTVAEAAVVAREADAGFAGLSLSPDGKQLAVSTLRAGVLRFALPAGTTLPPVDLGWETGTAVRLAFGADGQTLFTGGAALRTWELSGPRPAERVPFDAAGRVLDAAFAADGALLAVHADGRLREWDLTGPAPAAHRDQPTPRTGRLVPTTHGVLRDGPAGAVGDLAATPDGRVLVTAAARNLTLWERRGGGAAPRAELASAAGWGRVAVSADGAWAAAVERAAGLRVFFVGAGKLEPVPEVAHPTTGVPVFAPTGDRLLVVGNDPARPARFKLTPGGWAEEPFAADVAKAQLAAFVPDGRAFVAVADRRLELRGADTGRATWGVELPGRAVAVSVAADGRHVAAVTDTGTALVFRLP